MSVVSRSVAGSVVADSVRIPGRYRTPIPRTLLVVAVLVVAAGLGLPVKRTVNMLVAAAVLLVAVAISVAGPIGFLALVAPQIARRLWNTPGMAMWHSALLGAVILVLADFVSARALAPFQIPVGLVTGALGGVYMLWLLYRQR